VPEKQKELIANGYGILFCGIVILIAPLPLAIGGAGLAFWFGRRIWNQISRNP